MGLLDEVAGLAPEAAQLNGDGGYLRGLLDALPAAVYATDADGVLTYFNQAAATLSGRQPVVGEDRWCVTWRLYRPDGSVLPFDQCPMALTLKEQRPIRGMEVVAERPDGSRLPVMPFPTPLYDPSGKFVGAINVLMDAHELKHAQAAVARRADEQATLYRFTDRLYRAQGLADIYESALDAILSALRCSRASILLFDAEGTMRFVASRGLSSAYRQAVDGHTPWTSGQRKARPIVIEDMSATEQPDWLKEVVANEGISALAFIPLEHAGGVIGKFMAYYDTPHRFEAEELELAVTIARQLGFSIVREQAEYARRAAEDELRQIAERLRLATQAGKVGLWDWDIAADHISWTDSLYAIHGVAKEGFSPSFEDWLARVHPEDKSRVARAIEDALAGKADYELEMRTMRPDGEINSVFTNAVVLRQDDQAVRMVGASVDITERRRAEEQRDLLVAELSHRVKNTLATVISIARLSFPPSPANNDARSIFEGRIRALAQTHGRLAEANWQRVSLETIVLDEIKPYQANDGGRFQLEGASVLLGPKVALMIGMALHELATNAAKYGALSTSSGTVRLRWSSHQERLELEWLEVGGPAVVPPSRTGFGRTLLERALAADLRGSVALDFAPAGLRCTIEVPLIRGEDA